MALLLRDDISGDDQEDELDLEEGAGQAERVGTSPGASQTSGASAGRRAHPWTAVLSQRAATAC